MKFKFDEYKNKLIYDESKDEYQYEDEKAHMLADILELLKKCSEKEKGCTLAIQGDINTVIKQDEGKLLELTKRIEGLEEQVKTILDLDTSDIDEAKNIEEKDDVINWNQERLCRLEKKVSSIEELLQHIYKSNTHIHKKR